MRLAIFGHSKRPQVDSQNTGRDVYERPLAPANVTVNGAGGFSTFRSLSPLSPSSFNNRFVTPAAVTGLGNGNSDNPETEPLIDRNSGGSNYRQF